MDTNMLPAIAIYLTFKGFDSTADKAFDLTNEVLQIFRLKMQKKNRLIGRLPFGYFAFKIFCKSVMEKQYPEQGWDVEWVTYNTNEIHFNMKSCIFFLLQRNIVALKCVLCFVKMMMWFLQDISLQLYLNATKQLLEDKKYVIFISRMVNT
jgi:hypothetical protein